MSAKNKAFWLIGADDGSTGFIFLLEHDDGQFYELFKIEPDGDATAIGMIFSNAAMDMFVEFHHTATDPRGD